MSDEDLEPPFDDFAPPNDWSSSTPELSFERRVGYAAERLRVQQAARDQLAAEADNPDPDDLYLTRDRLRDLPQAEPLIAGTIPRHALGILRGRDHTLKTFTALDWAACLATGKPWQGREVQRTRIMYIAGEGVYGIADRLEAWEYAWQTKIDPDWLLTRRLALNLHRTGPAFDRLLARIQSDEIGLVVGDTLRRVSGRADGNSSDMGAVIDNLDLIKQATDHGSVLVLAHTDKLDRDTRGYSGIEDDADFVWHAKRDEQTLTLELTKMKDGPDGTKLQLTAKLVLDSLILSDETAEPANTATTAGQFTIIETMQSLFCEGVYAGKLQDACGLTSSTYFRSLGALKDRGIVINRGTPKRPFYLLAAHADSQTLPSDKTGPDLHNFRNSHQLPNSLPLAPTTPTTLRSGRDESESSEEEQGGAEA